MSDKPSLGSEIYSDTASFGRISSIIGAIFATLISLIMIMVGILMIKSKDRHSKKETANVTKVVCNPYQTIDNPPRTNYSCDFTLQTSNGVEQYHSDNERDYSNYKSLDIYYDPNNPSDIELSKPPLKIIGFVLFGLGLFILIGSWIGVWITQRYKAAAAASGIATGVNMIRNVI